MKRLKKKHLKKAFKAGLQATAMRDQMESTAFVGICQRAFAEDQTAPGTVKVEGGHLQTFISQVELPDLKHALTYIKHVETCDDCKDDDDHKALAGALLMLIGARLNPLAAKVKH